MAILGREATPEEVSQALAAIQPPLPVGQPVPPSPQMPATPRPDQPKLGREATPEEVAAAMATLRPPSMDTAKAPTPMGWGEYAVEKLPVIGGAKRAVETIGVYQAAERVKAGRGAPSDFDMLRKFLQRQKNESERGFWSRTGDLVASLPGFATEFLLTGGAYSGAKAAAAKAGEAALKRAVQSQVVKGAIKTGLGKGVVKATAAVAPRAAGVAAQTMANPQLVAESVTRRMLPEISVQPDEAGRLQTLIADPDESFAESLGKGTLDAMIELASERSGGLVGRIPFIKGLKGAVAKRYLAKPGRTVKQLQEVVRRAGWNGVLEEMGEERIGEVARGVTGVEEDYGVAGQLISDPLSPEAWSQLASEAIAFSVPGAVIGATSYVLPAEEESQLAEAAQPAEPVQPPAQPAPRPRPEDYPAEPTPEPPSREMLIAQAVEAMGQELRPDGTPTGTVKVRPDLLAAQFEAAKDAPKKPIWYDDAKKLREQGLSWRKVWRALVTGGRFAEAEAEAAPEAEEVERQKSEAFTQRRFENAEVEATQLSSEGWKPLPEGTEPPPAFEAMDGEFGRYYRLRSDWKKLGGKKRGESRAPDEQKPSPARPVGEVSGPAVPGREGEVREIGPTPGGVPGVPAGGPAEGAVAAEAVDPWTNVPAWVRGNLKPLADAAERSGVADKIEDLAAERKTAKQTATALGVSEDMVRAVRIQRQIPSWTTSTTMAGGAVESPEFTEWLGKRPKPAAPTSDSLSQTPRAWDSVPDDVKVQVGETDDETREFAKALGVKVKKNDSLEHVQDQIAEGLGYGPKAKAAAEKRTKRFERPKPREVAPETETPEPEVTTDDLSAGPELQSPAAPEEAKKAPGTPVIEPVAEAAKETPKEPEAAKQAASEWKRPETEDEWTDAIQEHQGLVDRHVNAAMRTVADKHGDNIRSAAMDGLRSAIEKYDPATGKPFAHFAATVISNRIRDAKKALRAKRMGPETEALPAKVEESLVSREEPMAGETIPEETRRSPIEVFMEEDAPGLSGKQFSEQIADPKNWRDAEIDEAVEWVEAQDAATQAKYAEPLKAEQETRKAAAEQQPTRVSSAGQFSLTGIDDASPALRKLVRKAAKRLSRARRIDRAAVAELLPGARITPAQEGDAKGWHIEIGDTFITVLFADIPLDRAAVEREYGPMTDQEYASLQSAAAFTMTMPDGTRHSGAGCILLAEGATTRDLVHELLHLGKALDLIGEAEWDGLVKDYAPNIKDADQQEGVIAQAAELHWETDPRFQGITDRIRMWIRRLLAKLGITPYRSADTFRRMQTAGFWAKAKTPGDVPSGATVGGATYTLEPGAVTVTGAGNMSLRESVAKYSLRFFTDEKDVDVDQITDAVLAGEKITPSAISAFRRGAKAAGVSEASIRKAEKFFRHYNGINKLGTSAIIPESDAQNQVIIREGVLNTPAVKGQRRERLDKIYAGVYTGEKGVRVDRIVEGGAERSTIPREVRGKEPLVFLNVPITQSDLQRARPASLSYPLVVTGNPHLTNFKRPHKSWDSLIKVVRIKPVYKGSAKNVQAVADAINYANEIGARILVTTFRSHQLWQLAGVTDNIVPTDPKDPKFADYWRPNPNPKPRDKRKLPDWTPYVPRGTKVAQAFKAAGWDTPRSRYGTGSVWWWPASKVIDDRVLDQVDPETRFEFCDMLHKGCTACRNCQKLTYPDAVGAPVWGVTDEPFCEHGCPQCFVRGGQSGVKGRKGVSIEQNLKQRGYGEADFGDYYPRTIAILQRVARDQQEKVDYVGEFSRGDAREKADIATSLYLDGAISSIDLRAVQQEIQVELDATGKSLPILGQDVRYSLEPGRVTDTLSQGPAEPGIRYSLRKKPPPKKTAKGYKLLRLKSSKPGEMFPLFAGATKPTPVGVWLDAEIEKTAMPLAVRPGWHLGDLPVARHIGLKGPDGKIDRQKPDTVWVEAEVAADVDWQPEANSRARRNKQGKIIPSSAEIKDQIPEDGYYRYKTNPNMEGEWIITGAMRITRVLSDAEVDQILREHGVTPMPREGGPIDLAKWGFPSDEFKRYSIRQERMFGRPDLANIGETPEARDFVDEVDEQRNLEGRPGVLSDEEVDAGARQLLEQDREGLRKRILEAGRTGEDLDVYETVAAKMLYNEMHAAAMRSNDTKALEELVSFVEAWRETGAAQARAFRRRRDPIESPAERVARLLSVAMTTPKEKDRLRRDELRKRGRELKRQGDEQGAKEAFDEADKINADWAEEIAKLKAKLKALGVDLDNLNAGGYSLIKSVEALKGIQHVKADRFDKAFEYWRNAILSAPTTQMANIFGNVGHAGWHFIGERFTEALVNSAIGDPKSAQFGEFKYLLGGVLPGLVRGAKNFMTTWRLESPTLEYELAKNAVWKWEEPTTAIAGTKGKVIRWPQRLLGAADDFCKSLFYELEVGARAYRIAKAEGLEGDALRRRTAALAADPTSPASDAAYEEVLELAFQQQGGKFAQAVKRSLLKFRRDWKPFGFLVPFVVTPTNIFATGMRKSPLGSAALAKRIGEQMWRNYQDKKPVFMGIREGLAEPLAEQILAWGIVLALMSATDPDDPWITGASGEHKAEDREVGYRTKPSQSIKLGDAWYSYSRLEPFATILGMTVDWINAVRSEDTQKILDAPIDSITGQLKNKTFLSGVGDLLRALESDSPSEKLAQWASSFAVSWVPNVAKSFAREADDYYMNRRVWGQGAEWKERLAKRTLQKTEIAPVEDHPIYDVWGRPARRSESPVGVDWLWRILIPIKVQKDETFVADRAILNYNHQNPDDERFPMTPPPYYRRDDKTTYMSDAQYADLVKLSGDAAVAGLSGRLAKIDADQPTKAHIEWIRTVTSKAQTEVRDRLIRKWGGEDIEIDPERIGREAEEAALGTLAWRAAEPKAYTNEAREAVEELRALKPARQDLARILARKMGQAGRKADAIREGQRRFFLRFH